jgi:tetratricopeptide (TPR) repeat protein
VAAPAPADPAHTTPPSTTPPADAASDDTAALASAEQAKQLYQLGAEAFAAQRNAEAIRYFRRAADLVPSAKLTYNIGLAYEEMGDAGRALAEYRAYLKQDLEGELDSEVLGRITALERRLADTGVQQLRVQSDPPGATVHIAGRPVGVTPWAGELPPGEHTLELTLAGHGSSALSIQLPTDRSAEVQLALAPLPEPTPITEPTGLARVSPLAWTFLGVGAGALIGGFAFELSRASSGDAAQRADSPLAAAEARGAADAKQMASLLLLGFGGAFTIGGGVLLVLDISQPAAPNTPSATLGVPCAPGFCGVLAQGHF